MTPTDALRLKLRRWLDEKIPAGGSDSDTRFLTTEIDDLLTDASSLEEAAAQGWREKAGMFQREMGDLERVGTGSESLQFTSLQDRLKYALEMVAQYTEKARTGTGSLMLPIIPLEQEGVESPEDTWDSENEVIVEEE